MITKETIKSEVEKVKDDYLEVLYKIVKIFEQASAGDSFVRDIRAKNADKLDEVNWQVFIQKTYGSFSDSPIVRHCK